MLGVLLLLRLVSFFKSLLFALLPTRAISKGNQKSSVDRTPRTKRARLSSEMDPDQENVLESSSSLVAVNNNRQSSEDNSKHYAEGENASRTVGLVNFLFGLFVGILCYK